MPRNSNAEMRQTDHSGPLNTPLRAEIEMSSSCIRIGTNYDS